MSRCRWSGAAGRGCGSAAGPMRPSTRMTSALGVSTRAEPSAGATRTLWSSRPRAGSTSAEGCSALVRRSRELIPGSPLSGSSRSRDGCRHSRLAHVRGGVARGPRVGRRRATRGRWGRRPGVHRRIHRRARQNEACVGGPATPGAPFLPCPSREPSGLSRTGRRPGAGIRHPVLVPVRRCAGNGGAVPAPRRGWADESQERPYWRPESTKGSGGDSARIPQGSRIADLLSRREGSKAAVRPFRARRG